MCNILLVSSVANYIFLFCLYAVFNLCKGEGTVTLPQCVLKRQSMQLYGAVEVVVYIFLIMVLVGHKVIRFMLWQFLIHIE
jgi:hypothetical protein